MPCEAAAESMGGKENARKRISNSQQGISNFEGMSIRPADRASDRMGRMGGKENARKRISNIWVLNWETKGRLAFKLPGEICEGAWEPSSRPGGRHTLFSGGRGRPPSKWNMAATSSVARHGVARLAAHQAVLLLNSVFEGRGRERASVAASLCDALNLKEASRATRRLHRALNSELF